MNRILPGTPRNAGPIDANFQEIVAILFSLTDANIATGANVNGAKLALNSLPGDRIVGGTITATQMGVASVANVNLVDLAVTKAKMTTTVGSRVSKAQTEIKTFTGTVGFTTSGSRQSLALTAQVVQQLVGGTMSWAVKVTQGDVSTSGTPNVLSQTVAPAVAIPVASTTVLGIVLSSVVLNLGGAGGDFAMNYIENT